jgi:predicted metalloprotease
LLRAHVALALIAAVLLGSCSDDAQRADTQTGKRDLEGVSEVPPLLSEPTDNAGLNIEALVRQQFADSVGVFQSWDPKFPEPELLLLDTDSSSGAYSATCDETLEPGSAFFCPGENKIYLDLGWLDDFSRRSTSGLLRDGAVFSTVAHELGHAWYDHVGFVDRDPTIVAEELFADCIAGAVIAATYADPEKSVPMIQEAAEDSYSVGSDDWQDPGFHGTSSQRREATLLGGREGREGCESYVT